MIRFFSNRELSRRLHINLARWKRWSREFLPPDPLGGFQSGYARQYSRNDAFTVYLGGFMVRDLNYTIPEAKKILFDLTEPLFDLEFMEPYNSDSLSKRCRAPYNEVKAYHIFIEKLNERSQGNFAFKYRVRGLLSEETIHMQTCWVYQSRYVESIWGRATSDTFLGEVNPVKILPISALFDHFLKALCAQESSAP
jgi:hypothetical protein